MSLRLAFALSSLGWLLVLLGHVVDRYLYLSAATAFLFADLLSHFSHVTGWSWLSRLLSAFTRLSLFAAPLIIGILLYLEFSQAPLGPPS